MTEIGEAFIRVKPMMNEVNDAMKRLERLCRDLADAFERFNDELGDDEDDE